MPMVLYLQLYCLGDGIAAAEGKDGDQPKKKMTVTYEHFQKVTRALVMRLRQHEESNKDSIVTIYMFYPCYCIC